MIRASRFLVTVRVNIILHRMSSIPAGNDATGASGIGPVLGYNLKLICFILFNLVLILNTCTCLVSLTIVMEILFNYIVNFKIKIYRKMPRSLTDIDKIRRIYGLTDN